MGDGRDKRNVPSEMSTFWFSLLLHTYRYLLQFLNYIFYCTYIFEYIIKNIEDTIELQVKRLPVVNLTGKISKDDFDSSKPYIYILREGNSGGNYGLLLFTYDNFDSNPILQVTNASTFCKLTKQTTFTIYCSSTAPNKSYLCNKDDGNATDVYKLVCQPTEMNEEVQYTLTKL